jgi:opacity protein-like surface antigen
MTKVRSAFSIVLLAAVLTVLLLSSPASAAECQSEGYRWTLRGVAAKIDSDGNPSITETVEPFERLKFDINSGEALGAELEYRVNCPVGIAFGLLSGNLDSMAVYDTEFVWLMDHDDVDFSIVSLGVNFHLSPRSRADFFIGPFIGVVDYEGIDFGTAGIPLDADIDGDTVIGLNAGLDLPFSDNGPWAFTAGLRYLATSADGPGFSIDVDPLIASAGIAYRWNGNKCGPCGPTEEEIAAEEAAAAAAAAAFRRR